jgi:hypothetical protein
MIDNPGFDPTLGNDGGCTGFQWAERLFKGINACCVEHDLGGTDAELFWCLIAATPWWAWGAVAVAVGVALPLARPIYMHGQRKGWWK